MSRKEQLLASLETAREAEQAFVRGLPAEERAAVGTYEQWCAKDALAHVAHWQEQRAIALAAIASGKEPPPAPASFEAANAACFQRFCQTPWPEVQAYAQQALQQLMDSVRALKDEALDAPGPGSGERPLWMNILGTGYTHALMHMAEYYARHGQPAAAGQLWRDWGERVSALDDSDDWQGLVHYNIACGLALSGNADGAVAELRQALELRPSMTTWSKQDTDLASLHDLPAYRELYAPAYWWQAIDAGPQAEALADQFRRALSMTRRAIQAFPAEEWRKGDTPYQRPAALALHLLDTTHFYCALTTAETDTGGRFVDWEEKDSSKLPSQDELLAYLDEIEPKVAHFLAAGDLLAGEERFRWTGSTLLSRAIYSLRHVQHHLAEICLELHRRELKAPDWQ